MLVLLYGSECEVLEGHFTDINLPFAHLLKTFLVERILEDWVLICLLNKNGSPYFFSFVCFFINASLPLSQDLRVAARWLDKITALGESKINTTNHFSIPSPASSSSNWYRPTSVPLQTRFSTNPQWYQ